MFSPIRLVNGAGDTVSKFRISRRKLRKQLIYPSLALGNSLLRLSGFLTKAKELQKLDVVWDL